MPLVLSVLAACWRDCPPLDTAALDALPPSLSATGLYADLPSGTLAEGVFAYTPNYPLWSDGAEKSRWVSLPTGATIDVSDPAEWRFPEGTRFWKEFGVDGQRVETRVLDKTGPGDEDWLAVGYVWNAEGTDATQLPAGSPDVDGTTHDVPAAADCIACHGGRASFALGFSAVQLAGASPLSLDDLVDQGLLSGDPGPTAVPSETDAAALGYLHANCSHCHNPQRADIGPSCYTPGSDIDFTLPAELRDVHDAPALQTASDQLSPGAPDESEVLTRMSDRVTAPWPETMPPIATEEVDDDGVALLRAWLQAL